MRRVLVARLDSVGDVLLAGPAIRAVAAGRDGEPAEVTLLCGPQGAPAGRLLPGVARVLTWACPWITDPGPPVTSAAVAELGRVLAAARADEAVILTSFHQSPLPLALLLRLHGLGRITGASVDFAGALLDVRLRPGEDFTEDQPEAVRALTIARAAGFRLPEGDSGALAVLPGPEVAEVDAVAEVVGQDHYVVVHPGAAVPSRAWPAENATETVRLLSDAGLRVLVTGGPGERSLTARVAGRSGADLGGRTDLAQLSTVLRGASVTITGNTGPAHLSAAVGTPVVSLFAPVVPAVRWAPYGVPVELLGDQAAPCRDTRARSCPVPGHPCLSTISAEEVAGACLRLLSSSAARPARQKGRR